MDDGPGIPAELREKIFEKYVRRCPFVWDRIKDEDFALPPDKPLTLAAYSAGTAITAYVEPVGVGDALSDMPVFLTVERYVPCPLEETYQQAWAAFPAPLKPPLESPPAT